MPIDSVTETEMELEESRVEASDLAGQLRDCRAALATMTAAHAERSQKVAELQAEADALQNELARVKRVANINLGNAWGEQQRGNQYRARALALVRQMRACRGLLEHSNAMQVHYLDRNNVRQDALFQVRQKLTAVEARVAALTAQLAASDALTRHLVECPDCQQKNAGEMFWDDGDCNTFSELLNDEAETREALSADGQARRE